MGTIAHFYIFQTYEQRIFIPIVYSTMHFPFMLSKRQLNNNEGIKTSNADNESYSV